MSCIKFIFTIVLLGPALVFADTVPYPKLGNPKGFACDPDLKALDDVGTKIISSTIDNIKIALSKNGLKIEKVNFHADDGAREWFDAPSVLDYDIALPVDLITSSGKILSIYTNDINGTGELYKNPEMIVPVFVQETGAGSTCKFVQGQNIDMPLKYATLMYVIEKSTKKVYASGLFGVYSISPAAIAASQATEKDSHNKHEPKPGAGDGGGYVGRTEPRGCLACPAAGAWGDPQQYGACCP